MGRGKTDLDELRANILAESLELANEPKYGYFGFAPPLAIGDTSLAPQAKRKADAEGETVRSFVIGPPKKGATDDVLFDKEASSKSLCIGDLFVDPSKRLKSKKVANADPESVFKPAGTIQWPMSDIEWQPSGNKNDKDPKAIYEKYKNAEFLTLHPPNIKCQPTKKGGGGVLTNGVLMGWAGAPLPEHVPDEYDRAKKLKKAEMERHRQLVQELSFRSMSYGGRTFAADREAFFVECAGGKSQVPREPKVLDLHAFPHEAPMKPGNPSKKGFNGLMGWPRGRGEPPQTFPDWIPDPAPQAKRKAPKEGGDERAAFRPPNPGGLDNPQKSVMMHPRNLRAMYPASFARPTI
jgi:hypothetical protein